MDPVLCALSLVLAVLLACALFQRKPPPSKPLEPPKSTLLEEVASVGTGKTPQQRWKDAGAAVKKKQKPAVEWTSLLHSVAAPGDHQRQVLDAKAEARAIVLREAQRVADEEAAATAQVPVTRQKQVAEVRQRLQVEGATDALVAELRALPGAVAELPSTALPQTGLRRQMLDRVCEQAQADCVLACRDGEVRCSALLLEQSSPVLGALIKPKASQKLPESAAQVTALLEVLGAQGGAALPSLGQLARAYPLLQKYDCGALPVADAILEQVLDTGKPAACVQVYLATRHLPAWSRARSAAAQHVADCGDSELRALAGAHIEELLAAVPPPLGTRDLALLSRWQDLQGEPADPADFAYLPPLLPAAGLQSEDLELLKAFLEQTAYTALLTKVLAEREAASPKRRVVLTPAVDDPRPAASRGLSPPVASRGLSPPVASRGLSPPVRSAKSSPRVSFGSLGSGKPEQCSPSKSPRVSFGSAPGKCSPGKSPSRVTAAQLLAKSPGSSPGLSMAARSLLEPQEKSEQRDSSSGRESEGLESELSECAGKRESEGFESEGRESALSESEGRESALSESAPTESASDQSDFMAGMSGKESSAGSPKRLSEGGLEDLESSTKRLRCAQ